MRSCVLGLSLALLAAQAALSRAVVRAALDTAPWAIFVWIALPAIPAAICAYCAREEV